MKRHIFATAVVGFLTAHAATAQDTRFHGVWQSGDGVSHQTDLLSLNAFTAVSAQLVNSGLRLIDVETIIVDGQRLYSGLLTEGTGGNFLDVVRGRSALQDVMRTRRDQNLRVQDVEIFGPASNRTFVVVFGPGQGQQRVSRPRSFRDFLEIKELWRTLGLELADVEVRRINGRLRYMGVFRSDAPPSVITGARSRPNFVQMRDRMISDGWELFDMERQVNRMGNDVYYGLWRMGDGESTVSRFRNLPAYQSFAQSQEDAGRQAIDFEIKARAIPEDEEDDDDLPIPERGDPPEIPDYITILSGIGAHAFRIEWTNDSDNPILMELPLSWFPDDLINNEGEILLPQDFCQITVRLADAYFWQVPGDSAVDDLFFNSDASVPETTSLEGLTLSGPIGGCHGTQTPWNFAFPLTSGNGAFEPLPNMSFVIEAVGGELQFE